VLARINCIKEWRRSKNQDIGCGGILKNSRQDIAFFFGDISLNGFVKAKGRCVNLFLSNVLGYTFGSVRDVAGKKYFYSSLVFACDGECLMILF
jgi:hypothetical protein